MLNKYCISVYMIIYVDHVCHLSAFFLSFNCNNAMVSCMWHYMIGTYCFKTI
uniref:Uncharacterized protein n=1 Tax=Ascaris lumbricoides TaxID=6252 RepID=A0A0M3IIR1_ASCLU